MLNPVLIKSFLAGATINKFRIVKFDSDDNTIIQGAASTDLLIGVNSSLTIESGYRVDVILSGVAEVEYGGNVTRGDLLTADSNGKAVVANPSEGENNRIVGVALKSGVSGDIGSLLVIPSMIQGA